MKCSRLVAVAALVASFGIANAALVDRGSYTSDTLTGLDWLDVPLTQGQSFLDAQTNQYANDGWHVAAVQQVSTLLAQYIGPSSQTYSTSPFDSAVSVARLLGVNFSTNSSEGLATIYDPTLPVQWQTAGFADMQQGQSALVAIEIQSQNSSLTYGRAAWFVESHYPPASAYEFGGVWMVRDSLPAVPEPTTWALMLAGLGAFGTRTLAKRQHKV